MQFELEREEEIISWEKFFNEGSNGVRNVEILDEFEIDDFEEGNHKLIVRKLFLRISNLSKGPYYAWNLTVDDVNANKYYHPFSRIDKDLIHLCSDNKSLNIGGINANNKVMDALFETIMLNNEELLKYSGHTDTECYRAKLIAMLHNLWD